MSDSDNDIPEKKERGARNAEKYKNVVIKTAKIRGSPHVNHRGKQLPGRRTGETCRMQSSNTENLNVEQVNTEDIIDFKKWAQLNFKAKPLSVRSYGKDVPKNQKEIFVLSEVKGTCNNLPSPADRAYNGKVPINHLKIADIAR
ncbi:hypothetical protein HHI36_016841, partial [Cryptolaemus montrouzieri]